MRRHFLIVLLLCAIAIPYRAHGADIAQSLAKMDALIKEMQALRAEFAALAGAAPSVVTPSGSVLGAQTKTFFTQSLALGVTNSDIEKIQKLLATDPAIYPYGVVSGFFGPKTEEGVKNFQTRFGLAAVGVVGPSTKTLFELFFAAYPDDVYPNDVLQKKLKSPWSQREGPREDHLLRVVCSRSAGHDRSSPNGSSFRGAIL